MRTHVFIASSLSVLSLLLGCTSDDGARRRELDDIAANHDAERARFEAAQTEFARQNPVPKQLDFGSDGTILLHECELEGYGGREELRVDYTFVNTTGAAIGGAQVVITVSDERGENVQSKQAILKLPLSFSFGPDSSYTTHFDLATHGVHLRPGWKWSIRPHSLPLAR